jgi:outer membrane protein, multidrug efflux system
MRMPKTLRKIEIAPSNYPRRSTIGFAGAFIALCLSGCTVGPNYKRPSVEVPSAYKEPPPQGWKEAAPHDEIAKGNWWEAFGDAQLNDLETQALAANPTLQAAVARVTQARANVRITRAALFPTVNVEPSVSRARASAAGSDAPNTVNRPFTNNQITLPLDVSYEVDLWGRVRRSVESARAQAQASQADYENILLTLKSDVAQDYFSLRYVDIDRGILSNNIELLKKALDLTQARHAGGVASGLDVSEAETLLATTQAAYIGLGVQRAQFEHALAVLVGKPAAQFSVPEKAFALEPPAIPSGLPSDLLERRPDVAEAERQMASANAQIGVARAAFFPALNLTGGAGYLSDDIVKLFNVSSSIWSIAANASQPLYAGGSISANYARSRAAYDESVANYRQQVLLAFKEVEDGLSGLRVLEEQEAAQNKAVASSRKTLAISTARYKEGLAVFFEVIDAQRSVLENEEESAQLRELRLLTTVQFIQALGGGWQESKIYSDSQPPAPGSSQPAH